jgi:hypothetical protein
MIARELRVPGVGHDVGREDCGGTAHQDPVDARTAACSGDAPEAVEGTERVRAAGGPPAVRETAGFGEHRVHRIVSGRDVEVAGEDHGQARIGSREAFKNQRRRALARVLHLVIEVRVHEQQLTTARAVAEAHPGHHARI